MRQVESLKQDGRLVLTSLSDNKKKKMYVYMVKDNNDEIIMFCCLVGNKFVYKQNFTMPWMTGFGTVLYLACVIYVNNK